ncbi:unnamed protein product [Arabidopsis halleri]
MGLMIVSSFAAAKTRVFWDVLDFPVPEDRNLDSFYSKVKHALRIEGYIGDLSIYAYGGVDAKWIDFYSSNIELVHRAAEKHVRLSKMLVDMLYWAFYNLMDERPNMETNFLIVAKDIPEKNTGFFNVLATLMAREYNVSLVVPDGFPPKQLPPHSTVEYAWHWTTLFDGGRPIEDSDSEEEDVAEKCQNTDDGSSHCADWKTYDAGSPMDCYFKETLGSHGADKRQNTDNGSSHGNW